MVEVDLVDNRSLKTHVCEASKLRQLLRLALAFLLFVFLLFLLLRVLLGALLLLEVLKGYGFVVMISLDHAVTLFDRHNNCK